MAHDPGVTKWPPDPRFVLEMVIVLGCFTVILYSSEPPEREAAFALLGVISTSIVANLARRN